MQFSQQEQGTQNMKKTLVIAEKPSVAGDIARALDVKKRDRNFYESSDYVVSSAVGHLLEISAPEKFEVKRGKWSLENLPVLPPYFQLTPIKANEDRLLVLKKLYSRPDISEVINACDAGREGELIFYNLMRWLNEGKNKKDPAKPTRRLWLNSMTQPAIRAGFEKLRKDSDMESLQHAAKSRAEADWLVGINATRAMTALHSSGGGFNLTTVGRVQTPTLAILVDREKQIAAFQPRDYWEVRAQFSAAAGEYEGRWSDPNEKKERPERIFDEAKAAKVVSDCEGKEAHATEKKKPQTEQPPGLFDLTSLQRAANARFHLPARATLAAAQVLYERLKVITYPRTDSKALPQDYPGEVKKALKSISADPENGAFAKKILDENWVNPANRRIFNDAKVSDHFAIIPTGVKPKSPLKDDAAGKVYRLILRQFLSVFYPPAKYEVTERVTRCGDHEFLTKGRVVISPGWREVAGVPKDAQIVPLAAGGDAGETVQVSGIESEQKQTVPPPRYTEATLLSAMEGAGKLVEDEELREAMRERGMGTPATRAAIIEGLVRERYVLRDGRELMALPKGQSLMRLLHSLKVEDLTLPAMTGEWESKLRRIERADFNHEEFMKEIRELTSRIVKAAQDCGDVEKVEGENFVTLKSPCPACGGQVRETHRRFSCVNESCGFYLWKAIAGREFSAEEAEMLLSNKETPELEGFRSKMGREFSAPVFLRKDEETGAWRAKFDFDNGSDGNISAEEMNAKEPVGKCPKCGAQVRDVGGAYVCEQKATERCDFSVSRKILQREIKPEEIAILLNDGKTSQLDGFVSKRTRRPFKAMLTMESGTGKLGFEFEPRKASKNPATKAAKKPKGKKAA